MDPERTDHAAVELLDTILEDGAIVQADVVLTVADVPLVGIQLRAAIAGMAAMTEHGMLTEWDRQLRRERREETVTGTGSVGTNGGDIDC